MALVARKKAAPTKKTLPELVEQRQEIEDNLAVAAKELYKYTATAKLGEYEFEKWRSECIKHSNELRLNTGAILKLDAKYFK